jgi:stage II sporulation protein D
MGYAKHGKDHAFILAHYYTGTQLARLSGRSEVRVLLRTATSLSFSGATGVAGARRLDPHRTYRAVRGLSGGVALRRGARTLATYEPPLTLTGGPDGLMLRGRSGNAATNGRYRGKLQLRPAAIGGLNAINQVGLEDYVRGVVAGESPPSWPSEALRTQAVAARTYAITTSKGGDGFDQYADTRSQVYNGISGERATTDTAVAATSGEVVTYKGKPVITYYFSSSGGRTENVENVFLGATPRPWLKSVDDPYDGASPLHTWVARMSLREAQRRLGGLVRGSLRQIKVLERGLSPRVVRAEVVGTRGRRRTTGPALRARLELNDTWARFTVITTRGKRGDAAPPSAGGGTAAGGTAPRTARAAARVIAAAGSLLGRVAPAAPGRSVAIEQLRHGRWTTRQRATTGAGGRYHAIVPGPGLYRIVYRGEAGPVARVG